MRSHHALLAVCFLTSCSSLTPTTQTQPAPIGTRELLATALAFGPIIDVAFDGQECTTSGETNLPVGNLVTRFTNTSGHIATPWLARCYPGKGWQDLVDWIGPPGTVFHKETTPWLAIPAHERSVTESSTVTYRQYDLPIEADYVIFVEYPSDYLWPCGAFRSVASE